MTSKLQIQLFYSLENIISWPMKIMRQEKDIRFLLLSFDYKHQENQTAFKQNIPCSLPNFQAPYSQKLKIAYVRIHSKP